MVKEKQSFEDSLQRLEKIVGQLEDGDLTLEESLELFEHGIKLTKECEERLSNAERRIEVLLKDEKGNPELRPIDDITADSSIGD